MTTADCSIVREFCGNDNADYDNIGKYSQFITSMQERIPYHGKPVFTDVYLNKNKTKFLLIRRCYIEDAIICVKSVNYNDMFNKTLLSKTSHGWNCMFDGSIRTINITSQLVERINNVISGRPEKNGHSFTSIY